MVIRGHAHSFVWSIMGLLCLAAPSYAQDNTDIDPLNPYGSGMGFQVVLTNSGFGLGGYYMRSVDPITSLMLDIGIGSGKDERELRFYRSQFGGSFIPNKANYLLMAPLHVGFQKRLFMNQIEDNFRPFLQVTLGPTLGLEYPYFRDENGNGSFDDGERTYDPVGGVVRGSFRFGVGGLLAIGAHFGMGSRLSQSVRIGYAFTYFSDGVQLLESSVRGPQRFFGTPSLSILFGRLFRVRR